ncbi:hypothetical protein ABZ915_36670 [Streptomyces sp. NPDC046915]|uniref:hypothetical protein n=1 Tax=Streptomyces sp. NPDC046915 TaxID=3155257 RepID=UPI0033F07D3C
MFSGVGAAFFSSVRSGSSAFALLNGSRTVPASTAHDVTGGWIGLGTKDAQWFYARIQVGDILSVTPGTRSGGGPRAAD